MAKPVDHCEKLKNLLECQMEVIERHIDEHKWFNQISDKEKGMSDFIKKYGWIMRELYCGFACELREQCEMAKKIKKPKT